MKIVATSDTHGRFPDIPDGDVFIHCGDFSNRGDQGEFTRFMNVIEDLPHEHKIVCCGNHEMYCMDHWVASVDEAKDRGISLHNETEFEIDGISFKLSSYTPEFYDWAFMKTREELQSYWNGQHFSVDVLITHGPPYGILDWVSGDNVGCQGLRDYVDRRAPEHHMFGHIHCSKGTMKTFDTTFHNIAGRVIELEL